MNYNMDENSSWNSQVTDKFCMHCGAPIEDDFLFCQICGVKLENSKAARKKAQERKQRKKRIILLTVSILVGFLIAYFVFSFAAIYSDYKDACKSLENGDFEDAYHKFVVLNGFMDSDEMTIETIYRKADDLLTKGAYEEAMQQFSSISYYKDSKTKVSECKYAYVLANKNNKDKLTYSYIIELKEQGYKDSAEVYDEIYKWRGTGIINTVKNDSVNHSKEISPYSKYVHFCFEIQGGIAGDTVDVSYTVVYPDGTSYTPKDNFYNKKAGDIIEVEWTDGIHNNPSNAKKGTLTVTLYEANTKELIGTISTQIK